MRMNMKTRYMRTSLRVVLTMTSLSSPTAMSVVSHRPVHAIQFPLEVFFSKKGEIWPNSLETKLVKETQHPVELSSLVAESLFSSSSSSLLR